MAMAPDKDRSYRGDLDLEAQFYTAVTGQEVTIDDLYKAGERVMTLQRCSTARGMTDKDGKMGCKRLPQHPRRHHRVAVHQGPGHRALHRWYRQDGERGLADGLTMMYKRFGWDEELGCPTKECLEDLGLSDQAEYLRSSACSPRVAPSTTSAHATYDHVHEKYCGDNPALNA